MADDDLSVSETAARIGVSGQTVRNYFHDGVLLGRRVSDRRIVIHRTSVDAFLLEHGPMNGRRLSRQQVLRSDSADALASRERDDLRVEVTQLRESVMRLREAAEFQRQADTERATMVDQLLKALAAAERGDDLRRQALEELEDALAGTAIPGNARNVNPRR
jgi:hypothetical protein